jgi:hypothetical protein
MRSDYLVPKVQTYQCTSGASPLFPPDTPPPQVKGAAPGESFYTCLIICPYPFAVFLDKFGDLEDATFLDSEICGEK